MFPQDLQHYLSEIVRVLKPNGVCSISYFLVYSERKSVINNDVRMKFYKTEEVYQTSNLSSRRSYCVSERTYFESLSETRFGNC